MQNTELPRRGAGHSIKGDVAVAERETSFEFRDIKGGCVPEFLLRHVDREARLAGKIDLIHGNGVHFSPTPRKPATAITAADHCGVLPVDQNIGISSISPATASFA